LSVDFFAPPLIVGRVFYPAEFKRLCFRSKKTLMNFEEKNPIYNNSIFKVYNYLIATLKRIASGFFF